MTDYDYWQKKLFLIGEADEREWSRLVEENAELQSALRTLRRRYGFPLSPEELVRWQESNPEARVALTEDLVEFAKKHSVNLDKLGWRSRLFNLITIAKNSRWEYYGYKVRRAGGYPSWNFHFEKDGSSSVEIRAEYAAIENPIIQEEIRWLQLMNDPVPQPQPMKDNPRKLDWRPVLEWKMRHPGVTHAEIAKHLSRTPQTVRKKLAELGT